MLKSKQKTGLILLLFIILGVTPIISQIENPPPYEVIGIKLSISDNQSNIFIQSTREPKVNHFRVNKPPRLVVDFTNAHINLPQKNFLKLPDGIIVFIRSSQYQEKPQPIARIVFDLAERTSDYNVVMKPYGVSININTPGYPLFSEWVVGTVEKDYKPPVETPSETTKVEPPKEDTTIAKTPVPPIETPKKDSLVTPPPVEKPKEDSVETPPAVPDEIEISSPLYKRAKLTYSYIDTVGDSIVIKRDPFLPVTATKQMTLGQQIYPDIERVQLVGIVKTDSDKRKILLEDNQGFGFILTVGDSVMNGKCTDISEETATFVIVEFGWSRSITLGLPEEQP